MCLILFAYHAHPDYPLLLAANRDEWFVRPSAAAHFWPDHPQILAGRDLRGDGTWLGLSRAGRFAALTNYRDPAHFRNDAPTRGKLVADFLSSETAPETYVTQLAIEDARYNGFSLLAGNLDALWIHSNRAAAPEAVSKGVHGLSNALLDIPWPKVATGVAALKSMMRGPVSTNDLLGLLSDTHMAPDAQLPHTGVSLQWERRLSATRIYVDGYGTRCSTAIAIRSDGEVRFAEQSYATDGAAAQRVEHRFMLER